MTKKQLSTLIGQLAPHLPEFQAKLPMVVFSPFREVLRGLYFERSGSDANRFYVWAFLMPMCIPSRHINFNLGRRIGGTDQRWDFNEPELGKKILFAIQGEGLPFLNRIRTPSEVASFAMTVARTAKTPYAQQACAYMQARAGETEEAARSLDELLYMLKLEVPWQAEIASRAQNLKALLTTNSKDAEAQLRAWEDETVQHLGLQELTARDKT